jgi:hypothetical protein
VQVLGEVDDTHTALPQFLNNSVMGDGLADHDRCERVELGARVRYIAAIVRQGELEFKNYYGSYKSYRTYIDLTL